MRGHFDPEFSFQSAASIIPIFIREIDRWASGLSNHAIRTNLPNGAFVYDLALGCKLLSFRLISLTLYGDAFDDNVGVNVIMIVRSLPFALNTLLMSMAVHLRCSANWSK